MPYDSSRLDAAPPTFHPSIGSAPLLSAPSWSSWSSGYRCPPASPVTPPHATPTFIPPPLLFPRVGFYAEALTVQSPTSFPSIYLTTHLSIFLACLYFCWRFFLLAFSSHSIPAPSHLALAAGPASCLYWKRTKGTLADTNQLMALQCEVAAAYRSHYPR